MALPANPLIQRPLPLARWERLRQADCVVVYPADGKGALDAVVKGVGPIARGDGRSHARIAVSPHQDMIPDRKLKKCR